MASNYFGGAPNAFAGGQEFAAAQRRRRLHDNALAAMIQRYGPGAADPVAMAQLAEIERQQTLLPYELAATRRADAAGAAAVAQHGAIAGDPTAVATSQAITGEQRLVEDRERETLWGAARNAARFLQTAKARGADLGTAYDRVQQILPALGVPSELLGPIREQLLTDPDSVDEFVAMLQGDDATRALSGGQAMYNNRTGQLEWVVPTATGFRAIPGYTPATAAQAEERLGQGAARLGLTGQRLSLDEFLAGAPAREPGVQYVYHPEDDSFEARIVTGSPEEMEQGAARADRMTKIGESLRQLDTAQQIAEQGSSEVERALARIEEAGGFGSQNVLTALARTGASFVPGTAAFEIARDLETISSRNMLAALEGMDATLAPVSNTDAAALQTALGQLRVSRDPAVLRRNLETIRDVYTRAVRRSNETRARQQRELSRVSGEARSAPAPAPAPATAEPSLEDLLRQYAP